MEVRLAFITHSEKYFKTAAIEACDATSDFQPTLVGGDGNAIQICKCSRIDGPGSVLIFGKVFVGYWPSQDTIVVGHEGTDPTEL